MLKELTSQAARRRRRPIESAGRVGIRLGKVSELTMVVPLAPGGAERLRAFLKLLGGNLAGADKVGSVHDMRFVFLDNDTRMIFATTFDGDWDPYIDDFVTKIPDYLDIINSAWEGWPGIRSPEAKDYLVKHQVTAEGWYVGNRPDRGGDAAAEARRRRRSTSSWTRSATSRPPPGSLGARASRPSRRGSLREESAMTLIDRPGGDLPRGRVTVDLDDIQATVLRYRPEPYYGTHVMLHVEDARAGRELLRRLAPHVDSAADWWQAGEPWIAVAITYSGLAALGVPEDSLQSFPEAFRVGMAARADKLLDHGENDPKHWEPHFGSGRIHIGVSVFSDSEETWRRTMDVARRHYEGLPGLRVLATQDFGAQPGDLNPLGYKDSIGQPAIEGSGVEPLPGQGRRSRPASSSSATPGSPACRFRRHSRTCWDEMAPSPGCASTSRESRRSTASCRSTLRRRRSASCSRRSWSGAGAAARR